MFGKVTYATLALAAVATALPAGRRAEATSDGSMSAFIADQYNVYQGDGSPGAGWPSQDQWGSYDELWNANVPLMRQSCGWNSWGVDNSQEEIDGINSAIQQLSGQTGVDNRFILAIIMQESKGCVRAPTTNNGVINPGLMQSHNGSGSCAGVSPCPQNQIVQMVTDGTAGTPNGDGLQQTFAAASGATGDFGSRGFYADDRLYNSGSANYGNLNDGITSTACYSMDVANRLTGWTLAATQCFL